MEHHKDLGAGDCEAIAERLRELLWRQQVTRLEAKVINTDLEGRKVLSGRLCCHSASHQLPDVSLHMSYF